MTQARTRTQGLVTPLLIQHWLEAALCAFVSLVQGVAATLGMILNRVRRDWHTTDAREVLPQAKPDIQFQKDNSAHGVILAIDPRISVGPSRGLSIDTLETSNRNSRRKPENDSGDVVQSARHARSRRRLANTSPVTARIFCRT